jgi:2-polyprenyl-3-methyl-5-hydroxy-6-metoxy-1,4-benzoquinol methylase
VSYQDKWARGRVIQQGYRECSDRYEIVRDFCLRTFGERDGFTVRDIGANLCYFGLRLTEDFPLCTVTAYESNRKVIKAAKAHFAETGNTSVDLQIECLSTFDALRWERCDLALAMSVLHHMPEPLSRWLETLQQIAKHSIVELATEPSARHSHRGPAVPNNAPILGYGESHLENAKRPIFYLEGK